MNGPASTVQTRTDYTGVENLEVMREAVRYNAFLANLVRNALPAAGTIVDFGAGCGTFARALAASGRAPICVELDNGLRQRLERDGFAAYADIAELPADSIDGVYTLNVLEHIPDDQAALDAIVTRMKPGAPILVYVPAFPVLYTTMDTNVGHVRRYRMRALLSRMRTAGLDIVRAEYVDSIGFFAALAYKWFGDPEGTVNRRALVVYDRVIFPVSRILDLVCRRWFGKNLLIVGRRPADPPMTRLQEMGAS